MRLARSIALFIAFAALFFPAAILAQTDPGVRSNTGVNAGQPLEVETGIRSLKLFG